MTISDLSRAGRYSRGGGGGGGGGWGGGGGGIACGIDNLSTPNQVISDVNEANPAPVTMLCADLPCTRTFVRRVSSRKFVLARAERNPAVVYAGEQRPGTAVRGMCGRQASFDQPLIEARSSSTIGRR